MSMYYFLMHWKFVILIGIMVVYILWAIQTDNVDHEDVALDDEREVKELEEALQNEDY